MSTLDGAQNIHTCRASENSTVADCEEALFGNTDWGNCSVLVEEILFPHQAVPVR